MNAAMIRAFARATATRPTPSAGSSRLAAYARLCETPLTDILPPAYPHLLAFPAAVHLMTARDFPFPLLGLVHIGNRITRRRPLHAAERLRVQVRTEDVRPHRRGTAFDVVTDVHAVRADGPVWTERSTYLHRERTSASTVDPVPAAVPATEPAPLPAPVAEWRVPAGTGRRYAAVSGDRNPIHLHPWTAKPFGFPRALAHGMWTAARCYAALGPRVPDAFESRIEFRRPLLLPATAVFRRTPDGAAFAVTGIDPARVHLTGTVQRCADRQGR